MNFNRGSEILSVIESAKGMCLGSASVPSMFSRAGLKLSFRVNGHKQRTLLFHHIEPAGVVVRKRVWRRRACAGRSLRPLAVGF
jgi:hypothetical protein